MLDGRNVRKPYRPALAIAHDQWQIILCFLQLIVDPDFPSAGSVAELPFGAVHIRSAQDLPHFAQSDAVLVQRRWVKVDADGRERAASHVHQSHTVDLRQFLLEDARGYVVHLASAHDVRGQRQN